MPVFRSRLNDYDRMPFGKHKDELLMDIPDRYFRWLREQDWLKNHPALCAFVMERDFGYDGDEEADFDDDPFNKP